MPPIPDSLEGGQPVQIVSTTEDHSFELQEDILEKILLDERVCNKKVCVVSVAGAFRKGKSFLLDFLLRYLNAQHEHYLKTNSHIEGAIDWIGRDDEPLKGFSWRGGSERETTGIWVWSQLFICQGPDGEEVVVMLMDTQGAFDTESTVKDCATVFALSTMTSSVQVFNLSQNIQEDDLHHLQLFTEYGRLAIEENSTSKPFQSLMFLVRDWSYPYEYEYGLEGGQRVLDKKVKQTSNQHEELSQVRRHIHACFKKIACFLMPHPGLAVAQNPKFDGRLADIDSEFKTYLEMLAPSLLSPPNLLVKEINGDKVTCRALLEYFKAYMKIYQGNDLPEPKTMLRATAEANNLAALADAKDHYVKNIEKVCGGEKPYLSPEELEKHHERIKDAAMTEFHDARKMGGAEFSESYADKLLADIEETYTQYTKHNDGKNLFNTARTPITLTSIMVFCYVISGLCGIIGLYSWSNFANLMLGVCLVMIIVWSYVRYTGLYREVGTTIDKIAEVAWTNAIAPSYQYATNKGPQARARELNKKSK